MSTRPEDFKAEETPSNSFTELGRLEERFKNQAKALVICIQHSPRRYGLWKNHLNDLELTFKEILKAAEPPNDSSPTRRRRMAS
jgi:hypothetical protein